MNIIVKIFSPFWWFDDFVLGKGYVVSYSKVLAFKCIFLQYYYCIRIYNTLLLCTILNEVTKEEL